MTNIITARSNCDNLGSGDSFSSTSGSGSGSSSSRRTFGGCSA